MQAMYCERKFTDGEPRGEIIMESEEEIDPGKTRFILGLKYGFDMAEKGGQRLEIVGFVTRGIIYEISKHEDITKISGIISCASFWGWKRVDLLLTIWHV